MFLLCIWHAGCNITGYQMVCGPIASLAAEGGAATFTVAVHMNTHGMNTVVASAKGVGAEDGSEYSSEVAPLQLTVGRTCAHYTAAYGQAFECPSGYVYDGSADDKLVLEENTMEDVRRTCCVSSKLLLSSTSHRSILQLLKCLTNNGCKI